MPPRKKQKLVKSKPMKGDSSSSLNEKLKNPHVVSKLRDAWQEKIQSECCEDPVVKVNHEPFKHCLIHNFLNTDKNAKLLRSSLEKCELLQLHNDMYKFRQSVDLKKCDGNIVKSFIHFLNTECRDWIEEVTGIPLNNKIAATCSVYEFSDYLLCHDDMCEDRRIAFILYLSDNWLEEYGGALQLFNSDVEGRPNEIVKTVYPEFNKFVFFEVSEKSFHQVQEVFSQDHFRISVNGWFHGPCVEKSRTVLLPPEPLLYEPVNLEDSEFTDYVNDLYLIDKVLKKVCSQFNTGGCVGFGEFLKDDLAEVFTEHLNNDNTEWVVTGPRNCRKYETCVIESLPEECQRFLLFMRSSCMFNFISKIARYMLKPEEAQEVSLSSCKNERLRSRNSSSKNEGTPKCNFEIQRWRNGCYNVLQDGDFSRDYSMLETYFFLNTGTLEPDTHGGSISYVGKDKEDVEFTIDPAHNSLMVAYKKKNIASFTTYVNSRYTGTFYTIKCIYGHG